jgi:hypothetical protein
MPSPESNKIQFMIRVHEINDHEINGGIKKTLLEIRMQYSIYAQITELESG